MKNSNSNSDQEYVEPPELRAAGVPPLRKQINYVVIAVAIIIVIVAAFAIYFMRH